MTHRITLEWRDREGAYGYRLNLFIPSWKWIASRWDSIYFTFDKELAARWASHYNIELPIPNDS